MSNARENPVHRISFHYESMFVSKLSNLIFNIRNVGNECLEMFAYLSENVGCFPSETKELYPWACRCQGVSDRQCIYGLPCTRKSQHLSHAPLTSEITRSLHLQSSPGHDTRNLQMDTSLASSTHIVTGRTNKQHRSVRECVYIFCWYFYDSLHLI